MHETHLASRIVAIATSMAKVQRISKVRLVRVRLGAWTHERPEALLDAFEKAAQREGATAEARLEIEIVAPECCCDDCGAVFEGKPGALRCQTCGSARVRLSQPAEMEVASVEG